MKLIIIGSSSAGNSYALQADTGEILLLEAGVPFKDVKRAIGYKTSNISMCLISHRHQDHAKYINEYVKAGIDIISNEDVEDHYHNLYIIGESGHTYCKLDSGFSITPYAVDHDVMNFSFLIHHEEFGSLWFFTDCYNMKKVIRGVNVFMCEANYEDSLLEKAVQEGKTPRSQADRVRLSHMSLAHGIDLLQQCQAEKSAKQIILIHGSSRHLNPEQAVSKFQQALGVPTFYAKSGMVINLM